MGPLKWQTVLCSVVIGRVKMSSLSLSDVLTLKKLREKAFVYKSEIVPSQQSPSSLPDWCLHWFRVNTFWLPQRLLFCPWTVLASVLVRHLVTLPTVSKIWLASWGRKTASASYFLLPVVSSNNPQTPLLPDFHLLLQPKGFLSPHFALLLRNLLVKNLN